MGRHPAFVDMTNKTIAGHRVLREAPSLNGTVRWVCLHRCGHEVIVDGVQLRAKPPLYCPACRPRRQLQD